MKKFLKSKYIYLVIGCICLLFSGLNYHNPFASIVAPIFLLNFTRVGNKLNMFLFFICISIVGALSQTGNNLTQLLIVDIINGISFGIFSFIPYLADKFLTKNKKRNISSLIFPCSIVIVEYLVSHLIGTWGSQAHSFYQFDHFKQLASITGIYGVWFISSWLSTSILYFIENRKNIHLILKPALILSTVFLLILLFGKYKISSSRNNHNKVKVATIISDLNLHKLVMNTEADLFKKLSTKPQTKIPTYIFSDSTQTNNLIDKIKTASANGAKIIVWNEASLILNKNQKDKLVSKLMQLSKSLDVYIVPSLLIKTNNLTEKAFNNVSLMITPNGLGWEYKKSFLQPTAEAPLINEGNYNIPYIDTKYGRIGNVICADLDMQHYIKQIGEKNIDLLVVPAYDWKEITPLHSNMASIQAVQFGCSIVRANGNGESAIFDFNGIKTASLNSFNSNKKIMYGKIKVGTITSIYSIIGDIFSFFCIVFILVYFISNCSIKKIKNSSKL
jgi:apolipoprotein N-acyltransferase